MIYKDTTTATMSALAYQGCNMHTGVQDHNGPTHLVPCL